MQTLIAEILAAWRRAERLAAILPAGSVEHDAARMAQDRLRDLYHDLTASAAVKPETKSDAGTLLAEFGPEAG